MLRIIYILFIGNCLFAQEENQVDKNGKKQGLWKGFYEESKRQRYEGTFENDKEVGVFTYFDDTKAKSVIATRTFSQNGTVAEAIFYDQNKNIVSRGKTVNRLKEGEWKYFHKASTKLLCVEFYKNGKLEGLRKVFFENGAIAEETSYVNGIKNGPYKKYTEKGIVLEESNFSKGKYEGIATFRESNGQLSAKGPFVDGGKMGMWQFYSNGKLKKEEKYPVVKKIEKRKIEKEK
jgi:antitoxin component YwqK of YwqJK toxin-antitoxin module